ncbi:MAG: ATP-binding protein [Halobacteria archaeon]
MKRQAAPSFTGPEGRERPPERRGERDAESPEEESRNSLIRTTLGVRTLAASARTYKEYPICFDAAIARALRDLSRRVDRRVSRASAGDSPPTYLHGSKEVFGNVIFGGEFHLPRRRVRAVVESAPLRPSGPGRPPEEGEDSIYTRVSVYTRRGDRSRASALFELVDREVYERNPLRGRAINIYGDPEEVPDVDWGDVAVPAHFAREVEENLFWPLLHGPRLDAAGLGRPRGLLLEGERGMGKSLLAAIIARKVRGRATFLKVLPSDAERLGWGYIFDVARALEPAVLYVEDIENLAPSKARYNLVNTPLSELLLYLDSPQHRGHVFLLATTNTPDMVELALLDRPGRVDRRLVFDPRNRSDFGTEWRTRVFDIHLRGYKLAPGIAPADLARSIEEVPYTGAHIAELVHTAVLEALGRAGKGGGKRPVLTEDDFRKARERVERMVRGRGGAEIS